MLPHASHAPHRPLRIALVIEQVLGNAAFGDGVRRDIEADPEVDCIWLPVRPYVPGLLQNTPVVRRNWTLLSSLRARAMVNDALRSGARPDVLYFFTQIPAVASLGLLGRIPTVVGLDATRPNMATLQAGYGTHFRASRDIAPLEAAKDWLHTEVFRRAAHVVPLSEWNRRSLVSDYAVPDERIMVNPIGVDLSFWTPPDGAAARTPAPGRPVRLLFVGGQFARKGGPQLLEAVAAPELAAACEVDVVTRHPVDVRRLPHVRVHTGLTPNSPALRALYHGADVLVLPTLGDTFGIVLVEAMACGLPVVASRLGALDEVVDDGVTGLLVPPDDVPALRAALVRLASDAPLRRAMGDAGVRRARDRFDGRRNNARLVELLKTVARRGL